MRRSIGLIVAACWMAAMLVVPARGQGSILFNNRMPAPNYTDQKIYLGGATHLRGDILNSMGLPGPGSTTWLGCTWSAVMGR